MKFTLLSYLSPTSTYPPQKIVFRYILTYSSTRVTNSVIEFKTSAQFFKPEFYFYCSCGFICIVPVKQNTVKTHISVDLQLHDHCSLV